MGNYTDQDVNSWLYYRSGTWLTFTMTCDHTCHSFYSFILIIAFLPIIEILTTHYYAWNTWPDHYVQKRELNFKSYIIYCWKYIWSLVLIFETLRSRKSSFFWGKIFIGFLNFYCVMMGRALCLKGMKNKFVWTCLSEPLKHPTYMFFLIPTHIQVCHRCARLAISYSYHLIHCCY